MKIPDFLRPENRKPPKPEDIEMMRLGKEYTKEIGDDLITESSTYTTQEWIDMLNECLKKNIINKHRLLPMKLQLFAEGGTGGESDFEGQAGNRIFRKGFSWNQKSSMLKDIGIHL